MRESRLRDDIKKWTLVRQRRNMLSVWAEFWHRPVDEAIAKYNELRKQACEKYMSRIKIYKETGLSFEEAFLKVADEEGLKFIRPEYGTRIPEEFYIKFEETFKNMHYDLKNLIVDSEGIEEVKNAIKVLFEWRERRIITADWDYKIFDENMKFIFKEFSELLRLKESKKA